MHGDKQIPKTRADAAPGGLQIPKHKGLWTKEQAISAEKNSHWLAAFHSRRKHACKSAVFRLQLTMHGLKARYTGKCELSGIPFDTRKTGPSW